MSNKRIYVDDIYLTQLPENKKSFLVYDNSSGRVRWSPIVFDDVSTQNTYGYIITDGFGNPVADNSTITNYANSANSVFIGSSLSANNGNDHLLLIGKDLNTITNNCIFIGIQSSIQGAVNDNTLNHTLHLGAVNTITVVDTLSSTKYMKNIILSTSNIFNVYNDLDQSSIFISGKPFHQNITYHLKGGIEIIPTNSAGAPENYQTDIHSVAIGTFHNQNAKSYTTEIGYNNSNDSKTGFTFIGYNDRSTRPCSAYGTIVGVFNDTYKNIADLDAPYSLILPSIFFGRGDTLLSVKDYQSISSEIVTLETYNINYTLQNVNFTSGFLTVNNYNISISSTAKKVGNLYFLKNIKFQLYVTAGVTIVDLPYFFLDFELKMNDSSIDGFNDIFGFGTMSDGSPVAIYGSSGDAKAIRVVLKLYWIPNLTKRVGPGIPFTNPSIDEVNMNIVFGFF